MKKFIVSSLKGDVEVNVIYNNDLGRIVSHTFTAMDDNTHLEVSDEYHSMSELYQHRMALSIALFHAWKRDFECVKSKLHADGTMFEGYFIVMAITPYGQISYHYKLEHWDKFDLFEVERTPKWDGHNSLDVIARLECFR